MRRIAGSAVTAGALAVLLTGCAYLPGNPVPHSTPAEVADATELLPTVWHVRDAAAAAEGTYLRFTAGQVEVLEPRGFVLGSWAVQGDELVVDLWGWSGGLHLTHVPAVPWLSGAVEFVHAGHGYALTDARGRVLARLEDDGPSPTHSDTLTTPEPITPAVRQQLADAAGVDGMRTLPPTALVGRWGVPGLDPTTSSLVLTAAGRWMVHGSCRTGTGTGSAGAYRIAAGGFLLTAGDPVSLVGCANPKVAPPADSAALTRFDQARSVELSSDRDRATFYDQAGHRIGTLTRLPDH